jgi:hypothetical protein
MTSGPNMRCYTVVNVPKLHTTWATIPCPPGRRSFRSQAGAGLAVRRSWPAHGPACKEADRFAVGEADGDLDGGFLLRSVEDAGGLVAGELGAWGRWTRRGRSLRYRPPLSRYRFTHLGSSSMLFLRLAQPLSVARSYAKRGEPPGVYKLRPARAAR